MNIIDAIKSGKPYRRTGGSYVWIEPTTKNIGYTLNDVLANDWETKETTITITESQFDAACRKYDFYSSHTLLKKKLGF